MDDTRVLTLLFFNTFLNCFLRQLILTQTISDACWVGVTKKRFALFAVLVEPRDTVVVLQECFTFEVLWLNTASAAVWQVINWSLPNITCNFLCKILISDLLLCKVLLRVCLHSWLLFCSQDYMPTNQDILHARKATKGITEFVIPVNGIPFRFVDVGGQRSQRQKWFRCFDSVTSILFLVSSSEFNQVSILNKRVNLKPTRRLCHDRGVV